MTVSHFTLNPLLCSVLALFLVFSIITFQPWHKDSPHVFHTASSTAKDPKWLLAIFLGPSTISRRTAIRSTWATRYRNPAWEYRFILGNYSSSPWAPAIEIENATYGDIWALDDFTNENHETANHIKNMEFFKYMVQHQGSRVKRYDFVSKVDDDNWFNIPPYYDAFIAPRLLGGEKYDPEALTMIGRPMVWGQPYAYASGLLYTMSWPLLELLAAKYMANPGFGEKTEDELMGQYLFEETIQHNFVPVELEQAWDIGLEHVVDDQTMLIHKIKDDARLLEVSTIFDEEGRWNGRKISGLTSFNRTMKEVVDRLGEPSMEEMEQLRLEWESGGSRVNSWESLDWRLIQGKISIEDREEMGRLYPLNLPGNNASTGLIPQPLGTAKRPEESF
ncbi:MAG: hypothetical protein OHK93_002861 [Ramalina farinacea]|uniref:Hexosyltransferase n=1 Tax=Ramalina farinacea TaxID=258253 RepID=A0AA43QSE0_9LECA|nr:hypothetical protein [Ramalina farinacea]